MRQGISECGSHAAAFSAEAMLRRMFREAWLPEFKAQAPLAHSKESGFPLPRE